MYLEITLFFVFVFHLDYFHESFDYEVPGREDVKAAGCVDWAKEFKSNWISSSRKSCSYWHSSDNNSDLWSQQGLFRTTPGSQVGFIKQHNVQSLHAKCQEMVVLCSMDPSLWPEHHRSFRIWNYCFLPAGWTAQTHRSSSHWLW